MHIAAAPLSLLQTTPELIQLFGGQANLAEVQEAWSSTHVSLPVAMYANGRYRRLADLVGTAESYDFAKPVEGDLAPDLTATFAGPRYWKLKNGGMEVEPVSVRFDMRRHALEVRVGEQVHGRASFEPAALKLTAFFQELGYVPAPR